MIPGLLDRLRRLLARDVSGASLAVLRIGFGLSIAWIVASFLRTGPDGQTGVERLFTEAVWHCPYPGLEWIRPLPEPWTTGLFILCLVAAVLTALGLLYRVAIVALAVSFTCIWLMDQTVYGNHFALGSVLAVPLAFVPAQRCLSLDALWISRRHAAAASGVGLVPFWSVALLRGQVLLIYIFGGVSKLHPDWLAGEPLRMWFRSGQTAQNLSEYLGRGVAGALQPWLAQEATIYLFAYGGLVFDLSVGFLLLIRRTRVFALFCGLFFHTFNYMAVDRVGVVAPMALVAMLIFLEPDWPLRLVGWLKRPRIQKPDWGWFLLGLVLLPPLGAALGWKLAPSVSSNETVPPRRASWAVIGLMTAWLAFQVAVPLRHLAIDGDAYWTEEGVRMSWFLMTRNKVGEFARFRVVDPELIVETAEGDRDVDWPRWQGPRPPIVFNQIDARDVPWTGLPELFVTYEPLLGERVFLKPDVQEEGELPAALERFREQWKSRYGRMPALVPVTPLADLLASLRAMEEENARRGSARAARLAQLFAIAAERYATLSDPATTREDARRPFRGLANRLRQALAAARYPRTMADQLLSVRPFDLQGNASGPRHLYAVADSSLFTRSDAALQMLDRQRWQPSERDFADLDGMLTTDLVPLPELIVAYDAGDPVIYWNHVHELTDSQLRNLARLPYAAHAYAQWIASQWHQRYGRRPQVYGSAYAQLNHHPLQPILDPTVDLAAAPYQLSRHNPWIMPLGRAKASANTAY